MKSNTKSKIFALILLAVLAISPIAIARSVFGPVVQTTQSLEGEMEIGSGQTIIVIQPTTTAAAGAISGNVETIEEAPATQGNDEFQKQSGISSAAVEATSINSVSISPKDGKVTVDIQTKTGSILQEISYEYFPQIRHESLTIGKSFSGQSVVLIEGTKAIESENEIEIVGSDIFIKNESTKQKIFILPEQAAQIAFEKTAVRGQSESAPQLFGIAKSTSMAQTGTVQSDAMVPAFPTNTTAGTQTSFAGKLELIKNKPFYRFEEKENGKLFGVINVNYDVVVKVDAQTGSSAVEKPFWTVFVLK